jgi:hypothetical protein
LARTGQRSATNTLIWQTARDNLRAAVCERLGAVREEWLDRSLAV